MIGAAILSLNFKQLIPFFEVAGDKYAAKLNDTYPTWCVVVVDVVVVDVVVVVVLTLPRIIKSVVTGQYSQPTLRPMSITAFHG